MDKPLILSTKKLDAALRERIVQNGLAYMEYDAIHVNPVAFELPAPTDYVVFSSKNAVKTVLKSAYAWANTHVLCVGKQSEELLFKKGIKTMKTARNMAELVNFIEKIVENASFLHFCGNKRLALLAEKMTTWKANFKEIVVYDTAINVKKINAAPDAILFYSPSGVESHTNMNTISKSSCFCIGETTAKALPEQPKELVVLENPSIKTLVAKAIQHVKKHQHA
ncbi:MAG: uroporphyrinogen-III synthase [Flavobacteriaceae bacterium]|jgi:uroporphyrinogen-III synthase|tara:strand:+ start:960 stop:1631 length:672 start_codon:yes stop_codon:yes gene_type:complete